MIAFLAKTLIGLHTSVVTYGSKGNKDDNREKKMVTEEAYTVLKENMFTVNIVV